MGRNHRDLSETHLDQSSARRHRNGQPPGTGDINRIGAKTREWMVSHQECRALDAHAIVLAGRSEATADFCFVRRKPMHAQVLVCEQGAGRVWVDGQWTTCGPGWAYVTPEGSAHAYHALAGAPWVVTWVMFATAAPTHAHLRVAQPLLSQTDARPLSDLVRGLYREAVQHPPHAKADASIAQHYTALIALHVQRLLRPWQGDQVLARLWEEVDGDLAHAWDCAALAKRAGVGVEQIRRRCLRDCGESPMKHLTVLRMRRAATLLSTGQEKIADIAAAVGYENPFAFSTAFRRIIGAPPRSLRPEAAGTSRNRSA